MDAKKIEHFTPFGWWPDDVHDRNEALAYSAERDELVSLGSVDRAALDLPGPTGERFRNHVNLVMMSAAMRVR